MTPAKIAGILPLLTTDEILGILDDNILGILPVDSR